MRKPVLAPESLLLYKIMILKEAMTITVKKIPSRLKRITVDTSERDAWREYIETV